MLPSNKIIIHTLMEEKDLISEAKWKAEANYDLLEAEQKAKDESEDDDNSAYKYQRKIRR